MPFKEYAFLCEFITQSTNGLHSYMHVFDRTMAKPGSPLTLNAFMAAKFRDLPEECELEIYLTDAHNVLLEKGKVFKEKVKGKSVHVVAKIRGLEVPAEGEYRFSARIDGGEPVPLCNWAVGRAQQ